MSEASSVADLVQVELTLFSVPPTDSNAVQALDLARRLDAADEDPQALYSIAARLQERLLALQQPFARGEPIPELLDSVMRRRAAAIRARLPERIARPFPARDQPLPLAGDEEKAQVWTDRAWMGGRDA